MLFRSIGWELKYEDGKCWSWVTQHGFEWEEMTEVPVKGYVREGRVLWMAVEDTDDIDSRYGDVREFSDDDLEISSAKIL